MIVSIVSGTYNRLKYLYGMVQSVRESIGIGITYEIVIVDGGSTDGTIEWCKTQQDIRLIEQGKLLGAVKAFNEGAYSATGKYVILANDDIEFLGDSIVYAITHMETNPQCGIGCFYQNRGKKDFHVEQMPAIVNGKQVSVYYGQVCIVRKFIGDYVHWWGDYLHTYGGDNELSCNVLELGYTVEPVKCTCINDLIPPDELRKINNNVARPANGNHPDTQKWLDKWRRPNGLLGANVNSKNTGYLYNTEESLTRILYLPIYEFGNVVQHSTKTGLRDALARYGIVYEIDYVDVVNRLSKQYFLEYMADIITALQPHVVITQLHDAKTIHIGDMYQLKQLLPSAKWVNWNGDYHPEHLYNAAYMMFLKLFDLSGFVTTAVKNKYDFQKINWFYWQIGYEGLDVQNGLDTVKTHDVVFLANGYSKERQRLAARLRGLPYNVGLYGYWDKSLHPDGDCLYDFDHGYKLYKNAKVAISDSQWSNVTGYCSNRLFQAMFTGVCLFQQYFDGMEMLGLEGGVNCIVWRTEDELVELLKMVHQPVIQAIGRNGKKLMEERHSFDHRVSELFDELQRRGINVTS